MRRGEGVEVDKIDVLKVDKDFAEKDWIGDYVRAVVTICERHGIAVKRIRFCFSKHGGVHFYIDVTPPIEAQLANRMQWLLGDDAARVAFNAARISSRLIGWNKLFEVAGRRLKTIYHHKWRS